ncbi:lamin tail domain-containing protein [Candidatus Leptofilum sp.]|uniref:lamin tail domain-containing protein n=1 Tax=Candidatus Leptofilum sp. TaxID=3241576 RepID=UPI003B5C28E8
MTKRVVYLLATAVFPLLILWATLAPHSNAVSTTILIDAVYYDGIEDNNPDADEAVRLINISNTTIDISNWELTDGGTGLTSLPNNVTLSPGEMIWLTDEAAAFARQFGFLPDFEATDTNPTVPNTTGAWPGFTNTGDEVVLLDDLSAIVDVLVYENGSTGQTGWSGTAVQPYSGFGSKGQILYRMRNQTTGLPVPDTDTAADWAQSTGDVVNGRKVLYPGWNLDTYFQTAKFTQSGTLTVAIAPDNAYETLKLHLDAAQTSIAIETHTFENMAIASDLIAALNRGVAVTILLEGAPPGGIPEQEKYICQQIEPAGGECWFMISDDPNDIADRYTYLHAKFILIDGQQVIISSENLSPNSMPSDNKSDGTWGRRGVLLVTDAPGVVAHVQSIFDADFDLTNHVDITNTAFIGGPDPGFMPNLETGGITYTVRYPNATVFSGNFGYEVVQSPENSLRTTDSLLGLIAQAGAGDTVLVQQLDERPYWGSSTSNPTDDPALRTEAYIAAARRGASVQILLDSLFDDGDATSNSATCTYVNGIAQAEVLDLACKTANPTGLGIHNKMVLVQLSGQGYLHVGSLNGSEQSSKGNRELALQVQSNEAYAYLAEMFQRDWGDVVYLPLVLNNYVSPATYVLISEVLYNPPGMADDFEFIELMNPTGATINLSNYSLGDAVNTTDFEDVRRFPSGTTIPPGGTIVVATAATAFFTEYNINPDFEIISTNTAVPDLIDDPAWGNPAALLQLANGGDEVILRDPNGQVVDAIAYGTGSFPGVVPCPLVSSSNRTLERFPANKDTNDCSVDFRDWPFPNPGELP